MENPDADRRDHDRGKRVAIAKDREKRAERRFDQHPVERVAETGAEEIAEGGKEPEIVAKPGLGISIDTGVEVRFTLGERLEHAGQGIHAAGCDQPRYDRAKNPGRSGEGAKGRGNDQMPAPTIEPTTIMVSANSENFWVCAAATAAVAGALITASRL